MSSVKTQLAAWHHAVEETGATMEDGAPIWVSLAFYPVKRFRRYGFTLSDKEVEAYYANMAREVDTVEGCHEFYMALA